MRDVFLAFLRLGSTSFGGPIAHLGYFRREFVERRGWLDAPTFASIVAFCSVLPGPTSSQVGLLIGMQRAGGWGALAAWLGFTLPSAVVMAAFGLSLRSLEAHADVTSTPWFAGLFAGLTAAAAAVVAQALVALASSLCTDRATRTIGFGAAILALALGASTALQWLPVALGAIAGLVLRSAPELGTSAIPVRISSALARSAAGLFGVVALGLIVPISASHATLVLLTTLGRAGALVFGGGHVVLPLLQGLVGSNLISSRDFFAGYGVVQAMPGPLFTFSAFLGAANNAPLTGWLGALVATITVFVPSFALVFALAPAWNAIRRSPLAAGALRGANASVVGILGAVLYHPILSSLGTAPARIGIALAAYAAITAWKLPPWVVVVVSAALGALAGSYG